MVVTYPTVAAICDRCSSQFSRYLKDPFPGTELQAQRLRSDLNVFIGTFAVHASGLFSLDSLLCAEPGYSKKLLFLLGNTAENLERGDCIGNPRRFLDADSFLAVEARQNQTAHPRVATDRSVFDDNGSAASSEDSLNTLMTQFTSAVDPLKVVKRNMQRLSLLAKYIRAAVPFLQLQQYADRIEGLDRRGLNRRGAYVRLVIRHKHGQLANNELLVDRLAATVAMRSMRFRYLQRHSRKLHPIEQQRQGPEAEVEPQPELLSPKNSKLFDVRTTGGSVVSSSIPRPDFTFNSSSISSIPKGSIPKPPMVRPEVNIFRCPFCFKILSLEYRKMAKWRWVGDLSNLN
jgi:hypothetical protein